ncbi:Vacuolar protein sorting-associated protein 8 [Chytriomyces hyalinus]|nr:Vacuolar protein sorting-associated protein 8 [Chytriomyces hyalinus]
MNKADDVQMANLDDVAAGAAWAESESGSEYSYEALREADVPDTDGSLVANEEQPASAIADSSTSINSVMISQPFHPTRSAKALPVIVPGQAQPVQSIPSIKSVLSVVSIHALDAIALDEDALFAISRNNLLDYIHSLRVLRDASPANPDLVERIDWHLELARQFLDSNADFLNVDSILRDALPDAFPSASSANSVQLSADDRAAPSNESASSISNSFVVVNDQPQTSILNSTQDFHQTEMFAAHSNDMMLKSTPLMRLTNDLLSVETTSSLGMPTVFVVSGVIAIGTSRGIIQIYNLTQSKLCTLGDLNIAMEWGGVTSIHIHPLDSNKVVAGHAQGYVCVWDVAKRVLLKKMDPVSDGTGKESRFGPKAGHNMGAKVLHVAFVGKKLDVVSTDDEGSAFLHSISTLLMLSTVSSVQLAGNQPIYGIQPLPATATTTPGSSTTLNPFKALTTGPHVSDAARILAVVTPFRLTLMRLRPAPAIVWKLQIAKERLNETEEAVTEETSLRRRTDSAGVSAAVTCACLAWLPAIVGAGEKTATGASSVSDPLLAATFGSVLTIFKLTETVAKNDADTTSSSMPDEYNVTQQLRWNANEPIVAVHWLNTYRLVLLTSQENVVIFDTVGMCELERTSIRQSLIIFHDVFSKGLKDYGIVPEMAYFHNLRVYKGRLFILGVESLSVASLMNWKDRLTNMVKLGDYKTAIAVATEFYTGTSLKAVSGLPADPVQRERAVSLFLSQILATYVSMSLSITEFADSHHQDLTFVRDLADTSFSTCLLLGDENLLFGDIFEYFCEAGVSGVFLEVLEGYMLNEGLMTPMNRPIVIQELANFFSSQKWFTRLEQLILHLDPQAMDIHEILRLCKMHNMFSGLVYVYNHSLKEYVAPLIHLLRCCADKPSGELSKESGSAEYILYVYLAYIFTGKSFPMGTLSRKDALLAKSNLYNFLFSTSFMRWPPQSAFDASQEDTSPASSITTNPSESSLITLGHEPYPYLRILLQQDSQECLRMLWVALSDPCLEGEIRLVGADALETGAGLGGRDASGRRRTVRFADMYGELNRQFIVDSLWMLVHCEAIEVPPLGATEAENSMTSSTGRLSEMDVLRVYMFVAKAVSQYGEPSSTSISNSNNRKSDIAEPSSVTLSLQTMKELFQALLENTHESTREDRQIALVALLKVYNPARTTVDRESLLSTCEKVGFWRLAEHVYRSLGMYDQVIDCFLKDTTRQRADVFECLTDLLLGTDGGGALEYSQQYLLKQHVLGAILVQLIEVDRVQTAALVLNVFPSENEDVIRRLEFNPRAQYMYLRGVLEFEALQHQQANSVPPPVGMTSGIGKTSTAGRVSLARLRGKTSISQLRGGNDSTSRLNASLCNLFLHLMIQFEPADVLPFLKSFADSGQENPYDFEVVLQSCLNADVTEPALWMLERDGQVGRALDILLHRVLAHVAVCLRIVMAENEDLERQEDGSSRRSRSASPGNSLDFFGQNPFAQQSEANNKKRIDLHLALLELSKSFEEGLNLCSRRALSMERWECESIWFRLLDSILEPHNTLRAYAGSAIYDAPEVVLEKDGSKTPTAAPSSPPDSLVIQLMNAFRTLLRKTIGSMSVQVKLPTMLSHLLQSMPTPRFGELRNSIFIMLEKYSFERELLTTANRILSKDAHQLHEKLVSERHRALRPMKGQCGVCRRLMHIDTAGERALELRDRFAVFECRHVFHERCLKKEIQSGNLGLEGLPLRDQDLWCVVCEVLNANGVRKRKKDIIERMEAILDRGKGKAVKKPIDFERSVSPQKQASVDLDRVYEIFDMQPLSVTFSNVWIVKRTDAQNY